MPFYCVYSEKKPIYLSYNAKREGRVFLCCRFSRLIQKRANAPLPLLLGIWNSQQRGMRNMDGKADIFFFLSLFFSIIIIHHCRCCFCLLQKLRWSNWMKRKREAHVECSTCMSACVTEDPASNEHLLVGGVVVCTQRSTTPECEIPIHTHINIHARRPQPQPEEA